MSEEARFFAVPRCDAHAYCTAVKWSLVSLIITFSIAPHPASIRPSIRCRKEIPGFT